MYISITGVTSDNKLSKYQHFDSEAQADVHAAEYNGFVVVDPGGNDTLWVVDPGAKTVTRDVAAEQADELARQWVEVRTTRNQLLAESDWRGISDLTMSDAWKTYRQALRDVGGQADPTDITWPTEPS